MNMDYQVKRKVCRDLEDGNKEENKMNKGIQKIIDSPGEYEITEIKETIRIMGYKYLHVLQNQYGEIENVLIPYTSGTWVTAILFDSYAYTHGGKVFRAAVEKCHELQGVN